MSSSFNCCFTDERIKDSYLYVTTFVTSGGGLFLSKNKEDEKSNIDGKVQEVQKITEEQEQGQEEQDTLIKGHTDAKSESRDEGGLKQRLSIRSNSREQVDDEESNTVPTNAQNHPQTTCSHNHEGKPLAGNSTIRLPDPNASNENENGLPMVGWYAPPPSQIRIRGPGYLKTKKKIPCPGSLYELVKVDVFKSRSHYLEVSQRFDMSEIHTQMEGNIEKTWEAPDTFVISFALPTSKPKMGRDSNHTNNKKGYITTGYYRMRKETRDILGVVTSPHYNPSKDDEELEGKLDSNARQMINGVKLWEQWCCKATTDDKWLTRLKFIAKGDNLQEVGAPKWICNYNGKPILIKRAGVTGFIYSYNNVMEYDLSLHPFPYMFKTAMSYLKENLFPKMLMTFSFVIEGRSEDELPEIIIGNGMQLCYISDEFVSTSEDVFNGTARTAHSSLQNEIV